MLLLSEPRFVYSCNLLRLGQLDPYRFGLLGRHGRMDENPRGAPVRLDARFWFFHSAAWSSCAASRTGDIGTCHDLAAGPSAPGGVGTRPLPQPVRLWEGKSRPDRGWDDACRRAWMAASIGPSEHRRSRRRYT